MSISASGPVSLLQLKSEWTNPDTSFPNGFSFNSLYPSAGWVTAGTAGVPTSGTISLGNFLGTAYKFIVESHYSTDYSSSYWFGAENVGPLCNDDCSLIYTVLRANYNYTMSRITAMNRFGGIYWGRTIYRYGAQDPPYLYANLSTSFTDSYGGLYINTTYFGASYNSTNPVVVNIKLNSSGYFDWVRFVQLVYNPSGGVLSLYGGPGAYSSATNTHYVAYNSNASGEYGSRVFITGYNSAGGATFYRQYRGLIYSFYSGTPGNTNSNEVVTDASGNIYVFIEESFNAGVDGMALHIAKYNSSGTLQLDRVLYRTYTYSSEAYISKFFTGVVDDAGNMYVAWQWYNYGDNIPRIHLARLNSSGDQVWARFITYYTSTNEPVQSLQLTIDNDTGDVFVATTPVYAYEQMYYVVMKFNSSGVKQFERYIYHWPGSDGPGPRIIGSYNNKTFKFIRGKKDLFLSFATNQQSISYGPYGSYQYSVMPVGMLMPSDGLPTPTATWYPNSYYYQWVAGGFFYDVDASWFNQWVPSAGFAEADATGWTAHYDASGYIACDPSTVYPWTDPSHYKIA
jgi:hypothetical protein